MDPNNNQPQPPQQGQIANSQPFTPPRPQPDWQQGLGGMPVPPRPAGMNMPQMPAPPPAPAPMQGSMPNATPMQPAAPRPGEIPMPAPANPGRPQPAWSPPPMPPVTPPTPAMGAGMPSSGSRTTRRILAVVSVVIVLALLAGAVYLFIHRKKTPTDAVQTTTTATAKNDAPDFAAIAHVMLMPPDKIDGFTSRQTGTASIKDYVADDGSCELIVGTTTAAQLPGNSLTDILNPQVEQLRKAGATVNGPTAGDGISVKDADNGSVSYRLPTMKYDFTQGDKHAAFHYSAAILSSGDRVVINRTCVSQNGAVDEKKMAALDDKARQIRVMKQQ